MSSCFHHNPVAGHITDTALKIEKSCHNPAYAGLDSPMLEQEESRFHKQSSLRFTTACLHAFNRPASCRQTQKSPLFLPTCFGTAVRQSERHPKFGSDACATLAYTLYQLR